MSYHHLSTKVILAARNLISSLFHLPVEEGRRGKSVRLDMPGFT